MAKSLADEWVEGEGASELRELKRKLADAEAELVRHHRDLEYISRSLTEAETVLGGGMSQYQVGVLRRVTRQIRNVVG
jgi:hypothetical protein